MDKQIGAIGSITRMIETAQINLGYCVIRAPFDGRVSFYQLNVGNLVQAASQTGIISITQVRPIEVVMTLPEADLPPIQAGAGERSCAGHGVSMAAASAAGDRNADDARTT